MRCTDDFLFYSRYSKNGSLGRITILCGQCPVNLHQFRLTWDSKYGLVGTDWNAIGRYFCIDPIVPGFVVYYVFFFFNLLSWMDSKQWANSRLSRRKQKIQLNRPLPDTIVFLLLTKIIISSSLKMWGRHAKDIIFILWLFQGWHFF